jgi:hypothetical protein
MTFIITLIFFVSLKKIVLLKFAHPLYADQHTKCHAIKLTDASCVYARSSRELLASKE